VSADAVVTLEGTAVAVLLVGRASRAQRMVFGHALAAMIHQAVCARPYSVYVSADAVRVEMRDDAGALVMRDVVNEILPRVQ
jgi:hypothetical protein